MALQEKVTGMNPVFYRCILQLPPLRFYFRNSGSPAMEGIVAIDPAGPMFEAHTESTRLSKNDAKAVQVLHTNSNGVFPVVLGYDPLCGSVDFYFNGALNQPGCSGSGSCAHRYGVNFLVALNYRNNASSVGGYRYGR